MSDQPKVGGSESLSYSPGGVSQTFRPRLCQAETQTLCSKIRHHLTFIDNYSTGSLQGWQAWHSSSTTLSLFVSLSLTFFLCLWLSVSLSFFFFLFLFLYWSLCLTLYRSLRVSSFMHLFFFLCLCLSRKEFVSLSPSTPPFLKKRKSCLKSAFMLHEKIHSDLTCTYPLITSLKMIRRFYGHFVVCKGFCEHFMEFPVLFLILKGFRGFLA